MSNTSTRIKDYLYDTITNTSAHGLPNIFKTRRTFLKLLWILGTLCSTGLCAYLVMNSVLDYLGFDVVTKISVIFQVPMPFPSVSICGLNLLNNPNATAFARKILAQNYIGYPVNSTVLSSFTPLERILISKYLVGTNFKNPALTQAGIKSMSTSYDQMFISCYFSLTPCNESQFEWYFDINFGSCFKFNPNDTVKTYRDGSLNGLQLEIFVPEVTDPYSLSMYSGLNILINNASSRPTRTEGISVGTGTFTNIQVAKQVINKLEQPYSDCIADLSKTDSELYEIIIQAGRQYTQKDCYDLCFQRFIAKECKCIDMTFLPYPNQTGCFTLLDQWCNLKNFNPFYTNIVNECSADCPLECNTTTYDVSPSSADFPTRSYADVLANQTNLLRRFFPNQSVITYEDVKQRTLSLSIYYNELKYTNIEEQQKTSFVDLIAGIGGTLGLFLGVSFLSAFELIEAIFEVAFIIVESAQKTKVVAFKK